LKLALIFKTGTCPGATLNPHERIGGESQLVGDVFIPGEEKPIAHHLRRFFCELLAEPGQSVTVQDDEAHHLVNVTRVRVGEEVILFDGNGREARAQLIGSKRREAVLKILSLEEVNREPARELSLACALPRATRMDWLVEKCCELGVKRLTPMVTQRSVVDPIARQKNHMRRWKRTTIEAAKQSGRTRLTEITSVLPFGAVFEQCGSDAARLIASPEPDALPFSDIVSQLEPPQPVFALIGPEGGFTPEEVDLARSAECQVVSLGPRILRVETAAIALAVILLMSK